MSTIFRGDFVDFDIANEDDLLEEFLGVPRKTQKADPVKTGAVAKEVGKLKPGKLKTEKQVTKDDPCYKKSKKNILYFIYFNILYCLISDFLEGKG